MAGADAAGEATEAQITDAVGRHVLASGGEQADASMSIVVPNFMYQMVHTSDGPCPVRWHTRVSARAAEWGKIGAVIDHLRAAWDEMTAPGAPFAMTETTVRGIPMRVFASALPDLRAMWELSALQGDKIYVVYEDERYSFADIHAQVRSLAGYLHDDVGVRRGDRVALAMRNYPEWVVGHWAAVSLGAAVVGMNAWWTGLEMEYALGDSQPKVLIADDERLERVVPHLDADPGEGAAGCDRRTTGWRVAR